MLDQISFHYKTKRTNFGRPTSIFEDTNTRIFQNVEPDPELREKYERINPFSVGIQASVSYSTHSVNTEVTQTKAEDVVHKEGGWPQGIDPTNPTSCKQTRSKLEKKENFIQTLHTLSAEAEKTLKLNVSIDLFRDHFTSTEDKLEVSDPSMRTLSIFRDRFENRLVSSISWSSESTSSNTKRVALCYTPKDLSAPTTHYESFIYNLECPSVPETELHPPSPLMCLEYNTKDSNFLVGGMSHGSLCLWDVRQGSLPVWISAIESSHRGAVNAVRWISSKTAFECVSVSSDGNAMTWDTRSNKSPLEVIQLAPTPESLPEGYSPPFGGRCLDYHTGVPTKYMVGTVEGLVMCVNRKASDPSTRISGVFPGHYGPVYAVRRHPTETKYFCSVSDWCCRFFTEDNKTPLLSIPAQHNYLTNAVWGLSRTTVVYTGNTVGQIDAWDLIQSLRVPVCSISVGSNPVYSMAVENNGQFLLTGDSEGTATLLELNEPLRNITQTEKSLFNGMMGRESKRVKNYDQFIKEQKMREKQKAGSGEAEHVTKEETPFNPAEIEKEFEAALKGEKEVVVEKKRQVIGGDDEEQQQAIARAQAEAAHNSARGEGDGKLDNAVDNVVDGLVDGTPAATDEAAAEKPAAEDETPAAEEKKKEDEPAEEPAAEEPAKAESSVEERKVVSDGGAESADGKLENTAGGLAGGLLGGGDEKPKEEEKGGESEGKNEEEDKKDSPKLEANVVGNIINDAHNEKEANEEGKEEEAEVEEKGAESEEKKEEEEKKEDEAPKLEANVMGNIIKDAHAEKEEAEEKEEAGKEEEAEVEEKGAESEEKKEEEEKKEDEAPKLEANVMGNIIKDAHAEKEEADAQEREAVESEEKKEEEDNQEEQGGEGESEGKIENTTGGIAGALIGGDEGGEVEERGGASNEADNNETAAEEETAEEENKEGENKEDGNLESAVGNVAGGLLG